MADSMESSPSRDGTRVDPAQPGRSELYAKTPLRRLHAALTETDRGFSKQLENSLKISAGDSTHSRRRPHESARNRIVVRMDPPPDSVRHDAWSGGDDRSDRRTAATVVDTKEPTTTTTVCGG